MLTGTLARLQPKKLPERIASFASNDNFSLTNPDLLLQTRLPPSTSNSQHTSKYGIASRKAFLRTKMSKANDRCRRSARIAASHGADPTPGSNSLATTRKRKDPPGPRLTQRIHKRTNIADHGPPTTDPKPYAIANRTKCFRISGIPQDWKEDDLLGALQSIDPDLQNQKLQLSLHPACYGSSQTALLESNTTKYFQSLGPNESYKRVSPPSKTEADLTIDSDFYGLTPLNTPDKQIIAELAVSCLPKSN